MNVFASVAYTYGGLSRWALGFDNPNKAAVLFACLALVALAVALRARRDFVSWTCFALSALAGFALLHTFSRGGLLAFGIGALVVLVASLRELRAPKRWLSFLLLALFACGPTAGRAAFGRLAASAPNHDASAGNRLIIWRNVPRMMADAPGGWGLGNSGAAFMSWYQPLERRETYRTLVGSHFTWLVEFGRWGRCGYVAAWVFVLGMCGLHLKRCRDPLPLALWSCFGTASIFSSVAEAWQLWILPGIALGPVIVSFCRTRNAPALYGLSLLSCLVGVAVVFTLVAQGQSASTFRIHFDAEAGRTVVNVNSTETVPTTWLVPDLEVLGGASFGRMLRAAAKKLPNGAWGIAERIEAVPQDVRQLAVCGTVATGGPSILKSFSSVQTVRVLSPKRPCDWLAASNALPIQVFCGEFAPQCPLEDDPRLTVVPAAREYLPQWPIFALGQ